MCGIAGLATHGLLHEDALGLVERSVHAMVDSLSHRGPDASGVEVIPLRGPGPDLGSTVVLGHRRLSIVDVAGSPQPCFNEDRSVAVTFNGELYNYQDLRKELLAAGHVFATRGDTEVLVHGWEEWGGELVTRLDGMFSFALIDQTKQKLFAAIDPLGQKPFYYIAPSGARADASADPAEVRFAFASEPRALLALDRLPMRVSSEALRAYLLHDYVPSPGSIFQHVKRLEPGSCLEVDCCVGASKPLSVRRYWQPCLAPQTPSPGVAETVRGAGPSSSRTDRALEQAAEEFLELLGDAVEKRLMADVPLGVFLSAGLDSSLIVGLLRERLGKDADIDTFSIGFLDRRFDESMQAQETAVGLGTRHHVESFDQDELLRVLPLVGAHLDEPFADPSVLPFALLCQVARRQVKVALGGDGGDELFAGYDPFRAVGAAQRLAFLSQGISGLARLLGWLPSSDGNLPLAFKVERFARGLPYPEVLRPAVWMGAFAPGEVERLWPSAAQDPVVHYRADVWRQHGQEAAVDGTSKWHQAMGFALGFFQRRYLPDDILVKVDRASMMHSLEVRSPFLDRRLAEWANALPMHLKYERRPLGLGRGKPVARRGLELLAARAKKPWTGLANEINQRPKKGFGIPVRRWLRGPLAPLLKEAVESLPDVLVGVDKSQLNRLLKKNAGTSAGQPKELWSLLMLGLWWKEWRTTGAVEPAPIE